MKVGDRVKVVANTYLDGAQSDHCGRTGYIVGKEFAGCFVELEDPRTVPTYRGKLFFEHRELKKISKGEEDGD